MTTRRKRTRRDRRETATNAANTVGLESLGDRIHAALAPPIRAALDAAIGVRHVYERDPTTGQWARVTDPDQLAALLNLPGGGASEHRLIVYTQPPDARLLEGLLAVAFGAPFDPEGDLVQAVAMAETGEVAALVTETVLAPLRRGRNVDPRRVH